MAAVVPRARIDRSGGRVTLELETGINNFTSFAAAVWDLAEGRYVGETKSGHDAPGDAVHPIIDLGPAAAMVGKRIVVAVQLIARQPQDGVTYQVDATVTQDGATLATDVHSVRKAADLLFYGQIWIDCV